MSTSHKLFSLCFNSLIRCLVVSVGTCELSACLTLDSFYEACSLTLFLDVSWICCVHGFWSLVMWGHSADVKPPVGTSVRTLMATVARSFLEWFILSWPVYYSETGCFGKIAQFFFYLFSPVFNFDICEILTSTFIFSWVLCFVFMFSWIFMFFQELFLLPKCSSSDVYSSLFKGGRCLL